ncbi:hypothetical protein PC119_g24435 [Phytophthora cactorum]|nr:hypothetical protein PC119_g24435 [Phytophthora cactorum]
MRLIPVWDPAVDNMGRGSSRCGTKRWTSEDKVGRGV